MILLSIAIYGDNERLARRQLEDLLKNEEVAGDLSVYRAWTQTIDQMDVDTRLLASPKEVVL